MAKIARGESAGLPMEYRVFQIAAQYGQTPAEVREWPADDFAIAVGMLGVTRHVG